MSNDQEKYPNVHYIGTIEEQNGTVVFNKTPIELPRKLLDALDAIHRDDETGNRMALQEAMLGHYPESERANFIADYLAPREYTSSYVEKTHFPRVISASTYQKCENSVRQEAIEEYDKDVARRAEENRPAPTQSKDKFVAGKINSWRIDCRNQYFAVALGFICSHSYLATLKRYRIPDRSDVKMFSTDTIGWTKYIYPINKDITIRFDSNCGFGRRVGYFQLGINYKGIELLPYSSYVRYYYANWRTLLAHTRSYEVARQSWDYMLEFVETQANIAISDPQKFVDEFIIGEVQMMTDGLSRIVAMTQVQFADNMNPDNMKRPRYLGVSIPTANDISCYRAYPNEMLLAYKAEKVTGALAFLGQINKLSGTFSKLSEHYDKILLMIKSMCPEISNNIEAINADINRLLSQKSSLETELSPLSAKVRDMDNEISSLQQESDKKISNDTYWTKSERHNKIRQAYLCSHSDYAVICNRCTELRGNIRAVEKDITGRQVFAKRLSACREVALKADEFSELVRSIRPHEIQIEAEVHQSLCNCNDSEMTPTQIETLKHSVNRNYALAHSEYSELVEKRDAILSKIDFFVC